MSSATPVTSSDEEAQCRDAMLPADDTEELSDEALYWRRWPLLKITIFTLIGGLFGAGGLLMVLHVRYATMLHKKPAYIPFRASWEFPLYQHYIIAFGLICAVGSLIGIRAIIRFDKGES